ncbi:MAG: 2-oxoacid:acceptor oxidoreductase family protein, partial [Candidatus Aminicenantales bacterium]
ISSPIVSTYDVAVMLNQPSLRKFESRVKNRGILIWESTTIKQPPTRNDIEIYAVPAVERATHDLKTVKVVNMVLLGSLLKINPIVKKETLLKALKESLPERHHNLLPINRKAIDLGMSLV